MSLKDIKIPADASDQQTTDAKSAVPPIEFRLAAGTASNILTIQDRQGVQNRLPTVSYRTYFLPMEFAPSSSGTTATVPTSVLKQTVLRAAGQKMADLVADTAAPGLGSALRVEDTAHFGQSGYYYCVAVNRAGVEAPPEHIVSTDSIGVVPVPTTGGGPSPPPIVTAITSINGDTTTAQLLNAGVGITITDTGAGGHTFDVTGSSGWTMEDSSTPVNGVTTVFTFATTVAVGNPVFADGRLMNETIGDYTRSTNTVTFAFAPISTVTRFF